MRALGERLRPSLPFVMFSLGVLFCALMVFSSVIPVEAGDSSPFGKMRHTWGSAVITNATSVVVATLFLANWCRLLIFGGAFWRPSGHCDHLKLSHDTWTKIGELDVHENEVFLSRAFPSKRRSNATRLVIRLTRKGFADRNEPTGIEELEAMFPLGAVGPRYSSILRSSAIEKGSYEVHGRIESSSAIPSEWSIVLGAGPSAARVLQRLLNPTHN